MTTRISLITALTDAYLEDSVIAALDLVASQEFELLLRSPSPHEIATTLSVQFQGSAEVGRIVIIHDTSLDLGKMRSSLNPGIRSNITFYHITSETTFDAAAFRADLLASVRNSETDLIARKPVRRSENVIAVTGTSGSPGTTSIAINLSYELAQSRETLLIDLNQTRRDIAFLFGAKLSGNDSDEILTVQDQLSISTSLPRNIDSNLDRSVLVDCGFAPDMKRAVSDRRAHHRAWFNILEMSATIVFVVQPEETQLHECERFLAGLEEFLPHQRVIIVFNKVGDGARARNIRKKLQLRINSFRQASLFFPVPLENDLFERSKSELQPAISLAPKRRLRRSIEAIAESITR